jgi:hypothetical protein
MSCGCAVHRAIGLDPVMDRLSDVIGLSRSRTVLGGVRLAASGPVLESGRRRRWSPADLAALPVRNDHDREGAGNDSAR